MLAVGDRVKATKSFGDPDETDFVEAGTEGKVVTVHSHPVLSRVFPYEVLFNNTPEAWPVFPDEVEALHVPVE